MRGTRLVFGLGIAALLASPAAVLAQLLPVNPERLDGSFDFQDKVEGVNNTLQFTLEGPESEIAGEVSASAGPDNVTIRYRTGYPNGLSAGSRNASIRQDRQVLVTLDLVPTGTSPTPAYSGQAAPIKCKVQAKVHDNQSNDPDDPEKAGATLTCDLSRDWSQLEDASAAAPPQEVLDAVEAAFDARKDVKVDTRKGKLRIKHRGEIPVP